MDSPVVVFLQIRGAFVMLFDLISGLGLLVLVFLSGGSGGRRGQDGRFAVCC